MTTVQMRRRHASIVWRELDDEIVILDLRASLYLTLNATGGALWKRLEHPATAAELAAQLARTYGLPIGEATNDVDAFIARLHAHNLIEAADDQD